MHRLAHAASLSLVLLLAAHAAVAGPKDGKIQKLLAVTGAAQLGTQMADAMLVQIMPLLRQANPGLPSQAWEVFGDEMRKEFKASEPQFLAAVTPIYDRNFTEAELDDLLAFYGTSTGKKAIAVMPRLMQESMMSGQQVGAEVGRRAADRAVTKLRQMGYQIQ